MRKRDYKIETFVSGTTWCVHRARYTTIESALRALLGERGRVRYSPADENVGPSQRVIVAETKEAK